MSIIDGCVRMNGGWPPVGDVCAKNGTDTRTKMCSGRANSAAVAKRQQAAATALDGAGQGAGPSNVLTVPAAEGGDNGGLPA